MFPARHPVACCEPLEGRALLSVTAMVDHARPLARITHHRPGVHARPGATRSAAARFAAAQAAAARTMAMLSAGSLDPSIFVQISGIQGESTDVRHRGAIDAASFSFGASNPTTPTSTTPGRPVATAVTFQKSVDSATPQIFDALVRGRVIGRIVISIGDPNNPARDPVRYAFSNVRISADSISTTTDAGGSESVSFAYDTETITVLNPSGVPVSQSFSFSQSRPV